MAEFTWTSKQDAALVAVSDWLRRGDRPVFRLFGYAGTGKTTLAKHFAEGVGGDVIYAAFTGKAAHVLQQKGCVGATTIHKLIYKPKEKSKMRLNELIMEKQDLERELLAETPDMKDEDIAKHPKIVELEALIKGEHSMLKKPSWSLNEESEINKAFLVVIDEVSMVDRRIGEDLLSYGVPILVLGDPAQLPPVAGQGWFTEGHPDVLLTEIRRQEADNPIIAMATAVREGKELKLGQYGNSKVISSKQVDREELMAYDQVLVGRNKTRKAYNARIRQLKGRNGPMPVAGDKIVCLRNNHEAALLNGSIWVVQHAVQVDGDSIDLVLKSHDSDVVNACTAHTAYFMGEEPHYWNIKERECFDYGSALTVHKAQGSQWDRVYLFDESGAFRQDARKWLYTGLTRAAKEVTVVV